MPAAIVLGALWIGVATFLQLARQPGLPSYDTIWTEDGAIFLTEALRGPLADTVFRPHASYLQVAPRLAAALASPVPPAQAALAMSLIASLAVAALSAFVFWASASAGVLRTTGARAALAGIIVLLPAAAFETNATLANLHWYLIFAAFWALAARPRSRPAWLLCVAVVVLAVLSDPLAALLLPVVGWQVWTSRSIRSLVLAAAFVLSAAVQLAVLASAGPPGAFSELRIGDIPAAYGLRVVASALFGDRFLDELYASLGLRLPLGAAAFAAAVLVYGVLRRGASAGVLAVLVAASVGYWTVSLVVRGTGGLLTPEPFSLNSSRYTVVPVLFLLAALVHVFDRKPAVARGSTPVWTHEDLPRLVAAGLLAAVVLVGYSGSNVRMAGPSWASSIAEARARCLDPSLPTFPVQQDGFAVALPGEVLARVSPPLEMPFFRAALPCDRLLGG